MRLTPNVRIRALLAAGAALVLLSNFAPSAARAAETVSRSMVDYTFARASNEFYKKVADQVLLDGAVSGLRAVITKHGGDPSKVPQLHDAGNANADVTELNQELDVASKATAGTIADRELAYGAISGMLKSLNDRWTAFLSPREFRSLNEGLQGGNFSGIGIVIDVDQTTKSLLVVQTIEGGPAQRAGIMPGDIILSVDDASTKGLTTEQDSQMIRGRVGSTVRLVVQRQGESKPLEFTIAREVIHAPSVRSKLLGNDIGYVQLLVFGRTTGDELDNALARLDKAGVKAVVLDLRNNGGGYLDAAITVSSRFVPEGPIVSIESRTKPLTTFDAEASASAARPLAVLINGFTASASEITAGAIQDSGAGTLIGSKTFGKGLVQTIYQLPDSSAIKLTTARYLTPKGRDINTVGIVPDIAVADVKPTSLGDVQIDTQLQRAIAFLQDEIKAAASVH